MRTFVIAMLFLAVASQARAGIRTDNGSLQNPNAITVISTQAASAAEAPGAG
ncbi:MAG TPA: hypothetical protein VGM87_09330 [Roseomonas sp.]|jgi:hypothetical protein